MSTTETALLVAAIGLSGVIIGAALNQLGAWMTAGRTLRGQRILARDVALREWRKAKIEPAVAAMQEAAIQVDLLEFAVEDRDSLRIQELMQQRLTPIDAFTTSHFAAIADPTVRRAVAELNIRSKQAFRALIELSKMELTEEQYDVSYAQHVRPVVSETATAVAALAEVTERFIFGPEPELASRPWWLRLFRRE